jgi:peroxiredoxin
MSEKKVIRSGARVESPEAEEKKHLESLIESAKTEICANQWKKAVDLLKEAENIAVALPDPAKTEEIKKLQKEVKNKTRQFR